MIKKILVLSIVALFAVSITSCREETTGDKIEDVADDVGDAID
ncbi:hypothetical protein [Nonlabens antarcticus]|nr:hypothetical protein [Nonlabens antarcticus]